MMRHNTMYLHSFFVGISLKSSRMRGTTVKIAEICPASKISPPLCKAIGGNPPPSPTPIPAVKSVDVRMFKKHLPVPPTTNFFYGPGNSKGTLVIQPPTPLSYISCLSLLVSRLPRSYHVHLQKICGKQTDGGRTIQSGVIALNQQRREGFFLTGLKWFVAPGSEEDCSSRKICFAVSSPNFKVGLLQRELGEGDLLSNGQELRLCQKLLSNVATAITANL